jgi:hypothetical protein
VNRREILDQRVAWLVVELAGVLELEHELSPAARESLLAVCGDVAAALERAKLAGVARGWH